MSHGPDPTVKYHEELLRYPARTESGKDVEILERITFAREIQADGSLADAREVSRRFDLRTGERLDPLGDDEFTLAVGGERVTALRQADAHSR